MYENTLQSYVSATAWWDENLMFLLLLSATDRYVYVDVTRYQIYLAIFIIFLVPSSFDDLCHIFHCKGENIGKDYLISLSFFIKLNIMIDFRNVCDHINVLNPFEPDYC